MLTKNSWRFGIVLQRMIRLRASDNQAHRPTWNQKPTKTKVPVIGNCPRRGLSGRIGTALASVGSGSHSLHTVTSAASLSILYSSTTRISDPATSVIGLIRWSLFFAPRITPDPAFFLLAAGASPAQSRTAQGHA